MEKIKFTLQILVLVLAFPFWFFAEMNMAGKTVNHVEENNSDSIQVKKAAMMKLGTAAEDFDAKTTGINRLMLFSN